MPNPNANANANANPKPNLDLHLHCNRNPNPDPNQAARPGERGGGARNARLGAGASAARDGCLLCGPGRAARLRELGRPVGRVMCCCRARVTHTPLRFAAPARFCALDTFISNLRAHPRDPTPHSPPEVSRALLSPLFEVRSALARDARIAWSSWRCTASLLWRRWARRHPPSNSLVTPRSATVSKPRIQLGSSGLRPTSQRRLVHLCCRRTTTTVSDSSSSPPGVDPTECVRHACVCPQPTTPC